MNITDVLKILLSIIFVSGIVFAFTKSLKRLLQVASGLALYELWNTLWDFGLWPLFQGLFRGYGMLGLTITATVVNFLVLRFYQKNCKTDWLGITVIDDVVHRADEVQKRFRESSGFRRALLALPCFGLLVAKKTIHGKWLPILVLTIFMDSFVATAYWLHSNNKSVNSELKKKDYVFFLVCTVVSCLAWTAFTEWLTLPAVKNLWNLFPE